MTTIFITATGTDVGKTYVAAALIRALKARNINVDAIKPALSGYTGFAGSDAAVLLEALGKGEADIETMSPMRFAAALAPPSSARAEGRTVDLGAMNQFCRTRMSAMRDGILLIEGIGGVMSPMADGATSLDLISDLEAPSILVAGTYLGSVTHTLTAIESMRARYLPILAVVASQSEGANPDPQEMTNAMAEFQPTIPIFVAPRADTWDAGALADYLLAKVRA